MGWYQKGGLLLVSLGNTIVSAVIWGLQLELLISAACGLSSSRLAQASSPGSTDLKESKRGSARTLDTVAQILNNAISVAFYWSK